MKYDETLIMRYGEVDIEKIILSILTKEKKEINEVYNESRKSSNRDCILIEKKIALENYILKYYNNPKNAELKKAMNAVVNGVGKGFSTGNIEMLSSLFLKSENASKLYNTKQLTFLSDTMKKLQTKTNQIYSNFLKGKELNDFEKKCLMKFFIYYKGADVKSNVYKAQLNYMNYLFNKDNYDKTLNNIDELEFVSNFTVAHFFRYFYKNIPEPSIIMGSLPNYSRGCSTGATVIIRDIPEVFLNRLETLKTINHECRHVIQSAKLEKEKNISAYDMTKRVLFSKFLSTKDYDNYRQNYRFEPIERDAETTGYFKTRVMLDEIIDDKEVFKKVDFYLRDLEENTKEKELILLLL